MSKLDAIIILLIIGLAVSGCVASSEEQIDELKAPLRYDLDQQLRGLLETKGIGRLDPGLEPDTELATLGQFLFFDKILSGNRDISCATCHHPTFSAGDALPVAIGTGGAGLGDSRILGKERNLIPRNSPELFNRGAEEWTTMFWDSRVSVDPDGKFGSPAGSWLPDGLNNILAVQAMFPVTSRDEMRGSYGDAKATNGNNELTLFEDNDLLAIWEALMTRLLAYPEYVQLFENAYPDIALDELGFQHAANAIAAFEIQAFTFYRSPWYRYLEGDDAAISDEAKEGALLFYDQAGCADCHSGPLFTDQKHHVLASPQVGPGKGEEAPWDLGRFRETGEAADKFAFRTPPLHNVTQTGPWMHAGAYSTLEAVIRHHLDPASLLRSYDPEKHLPPEVQSTFQSDEVLIEQMLANIDPLMAEVRTLTDDQIATLIAFLEYLTDPAVTKLDKLVPESVPSGLSMKE
jgi:cytochrome c peroxidase